MRPRSRAGWSKRDVVWALFGLAVLAVLGAFSNSLIEHGKYFMQGLQPVAAAPAQQPFRQGSIVFVSRNSDLCRKQALDNKTGEIGDSRLVSCQNGGPVVQPPNVDAFRDGFQRK
jgi:hypothetical protein